MLHPALFSGEYQVRALCEAELPEILRLCSGNPLYYAHFPPPATEQSILADMRALPPRTEAKDKYYVGFFDGERLIAVLDLIEGYPKKGTAWIGFFMTDAAVQNTGVGTRIVDALCACLREYGLDAVMLCWVRGNPQAEHFWKKNRFSETGHLWEQESRTLVLARRLLAQENTPPEAERI